MDNREFGPNRMDCMSTDSSSARDVSYNPEQHSRMKHVARRHFFIRDMVESQEIVRATLGRSENPKKQIISLPTASQKQSIVDPEAYTYILENCSA